MKSMKKTFSMKRLLSLLLAAVLVMSTFVVAGATSPLTASADDGDAYLFAYFTGNATTEQTIHFATSSNGTDFTALNGNQAVINQTKGTGCARDPYIFKGQDGYYYIIATDMNANLGWSEKSDSFVLWRSKDLITWTDESIIDLSDFACLSGDRIFNAWAPEVIWNPASNKYMVYFALKAETYTGGINTLYYMETSNLLDPSSYSDPQLLFKRADNNDAIDGDITYDSANGIYYLYYKNESSTSKHLFCASSTSLTGPYNDVKEVSTTALEGCQFYTIGDQQVLVADDYGSNGNFVRYNVTDYTTFTEQSGRVFSNLSPRHGSIIPITAEQKTQLESSTITTSALNSTENASDYLIARYFTTDNAAEDVSGNNKTLTTVQSLSMGMYQNKFSAQFTSNSSNSGAHTGSYASISAATLLDGVNINDGFSFSFYGYGSKKDADRFFDLNNSGVGKLIWGSTGDTDPNLYDFTFVSAGHEDKTSGYGKVGARNLANETSFVNTSATLNNWHHYTVSYTDGNMVVYVDGVKAGVICKFDGAQLNAEWLSRLITSGTMYFGVSAWQNDGTLDGAISDFCVYNKALSYNDIKSVELNNKANDLENIIASYENLMNAGTMYTNMAPAYQAYIDAKELYDSYTYGTNSAADFSASSSTVTTEQLATAASTLETAIANMGTWTQYTTDITMNMPVDENPLTEQESVNIVYSGNESKAGEKVEGVACSMNPDNVTASIMYSTLVLLYDGVNTPKFPVMVRAQRQGSKTRYMYTVYPCSDGKGKKDGVVDTVSNPQFAIMDKNGGHRWYGTDVRWNYGYTYNQPTIIGGDLNNSQNNYSGTLNDMTYFSSTCGFSGSFGANEYSKAMNIKWGIRTSGTQSDSSNVSVADFASADASKTTYVLNYKPLKDKLDTAKSDISSINNIALYDSVSSDMYNYLLAVDKGTAVNPSSYDYASNQATAVTNCANAISSAVSSLNVSKPAAGTEIYQSLRDYLVEADVDENTDGMYTTASYDAYVTARNLALQAINNVVANDYVTTFSSKDIQTIADELHTAYLGLTLDHVFSFGKINESDADEALFTCTTCKGDSLPIDISAYNALAKVYDSIDMNKYNDTTALKAAKAQFDAILTSAYLAGPFDTIEAAETKIAADIDAQINNLLSAINTANTDQEVTYTVDLQMNGVTKATFDDAVYNVSKTYDISAFLETDAIQYWTVTTGDGVTNINTSDTSINFAVTSQPASGNVIINVVTKPASGYLINVERIDGTAITQGYASGSTLDIENANYDITSDSTAVVSVPKIIYYTGVDYWTVKGDTKKYSVTDADTTNDSIPVTANMTLVVHYKSANGYTATNPDGKGTFTIYQDTSYTNLDTSAKLEGGLMLNQCMNITTTDADFGAWAIETPDFGTQIVSYKSNFNYLQEGNFEFKMLTKDEVDADPVPTTRVRSVSAKIDGEGSSETGVFQFKDTATGKNKVSVLCQVVSKPGSSYTVTDAGVVVASGAKTEDELQIGKTGAIKLSASNRSPEGQYSSTMSSPNAINLSIRSYVTYSYLYNGKTITVTDYSPIVTGAQG